MAARGVDRRVIALAVGIPVLMIGSFVLVEVVGGAGGADDAVTTTVATDPPASTAPLAVDEAWNDALEESLRPLEEAIPRLAEAVTSWSAGDLDDAALAAVLDRVEPVFEQVRSATQELPEHPADRLAAPLVRQMGRLYGLSVDAHRLAIAADGGVATQYDRLGRRLRVLGDRVFDRARERTAVAFDPGEGVDLRRPAELPDWTRLGLGVGPPLEPAETDVDAAPRQRREERPSQPRSDWEAAVEDLEAPAAGDVRAALAEGDAGRLAELARSLAAATEVLAAMPVPDGDRGRADRLGLAWLLRADAARAGQLAVVADTGTATGAGDRPGPVLADAILEVSTTGALSAP